MAGTSPAVAIAVFAITAAAPISIASHAWEGLPIPASTITGRSISSIRIWINSFVARPLLEPIGDANGITAAAPALTRSRAVYRSGYMYGSTTNPSFASISVAFTVSTLSGSRYLLSFIISTFTKSPHPSSLAMRAMRTASFASLAPEVFGSNVTLSGIKSRMFSFFFVLVRRTANVIICAPAFSTAALISSMEYFPDPKIKREENSFPPNVNVSFFIFSSFFLVFSLVFFFK